VIWRLGTKRIAGLICLLPLATAGFAAALFAQSTTPTPETVEDALHQMFDAAGVIFTGEVAAIRRIAGENGASGIVEIDFSVSEGIRGCTPGSTYTLREWAGLWAGGDERYRVGQRLLMLLHSPGAGGVSSPVGGMAGAIPIRGTAALPILSSASTEGSPEIADLRWVGTRLLREVPLTSSPVVTGQTGNSNGSDAGEVSTASQQAAVTTVVQMLRSWGQQGR
jgi:hypothetical protein